MYCDVKRHSRLRCESEVSESKNNTDGITTLHVPGKFMDLNVNGNEISFVCGEIRAYNGFIATRRYDSYSFMC